MPKATRRIDHAVVAVHALDAAAAFYQRLGFQVGPRNHHPWGTENRLIQFASSFIELITVGGDAQAIPDHAIGQFSFGAFVREYLATGEGLAMLALDSKDAKADAALYADTGIGTFEPFFFERKGRRPDGSEVHMAFTLAFAVDAQAPQAGFFVCQQHFPENFWNPTFQQHDNGASDITGIGMSVAEPRAHTAFLTTFTGSEAKPGSEKRWTIGLSGGGRIEVAADLEGENPHLHKLAIRVPDLAVQTVRLEQQGVHFTRAANCLTIPSTAAFGMTLCFEGPGVGAD